MLWSEFPHGPLQLSPAGDVWKAGTRPHLSCRGVWHLSLTPRAQTCGLQAKLHGPQPRESPYGAGGRSCLLHTQGDGQGQGCCSPLPSAPGPPSSDSQNPTASHIQRETSHLERNIPSRVSVFFIPTVSLTLCLPSPTSPWAQPLVPREPGVLRHGSSGMRGGSTIAIQQASAEAEYRVSGRGTPAGSSQAPFPVSAPSRPWDS